MRPNFTFSLGLRYELQTNISDHQRFRAAPGLRLGARNRQERPPEDRHPRRLRHVLRPHRRKPHRARLLLNGINQLSYLVTNPDFYPNIPPLSTLTPAQNSIYRLDPKLRADYSMQSAIGVERQLPRNTTFAVTYTNTRALHLPQTVPINTPLPGTYPAGQPSQRRAPLRPRRRQPVRVRIGRPHEAEHPDGQLQHALQQERFAVRELLAQLRQRLARLADRIPTISCRTGGVRRWSAGTGSSWWAR